jgi:fluoride exporter
VERILLIALGGAVGSVLRYAAGGTVHRFAGSTFPWGTLAVNATGSFAIGFLWAFFDRVSGSTLARSFMFIGILGGYTTFSSYTLETFNLLRDGEIKLGLINMFAANIAGIVFVFAGFHLCEYLLKLRGI